MSSVLQLAHCTIFLHNSTLITFHCSSNDEAMWDDRYDRLHPSKRMLEKKWFCKIYKSLGQIGWTWAIPVAPLCDLIDKSDIQNNCYYKF